MGLLFRSPATPSEIQREMLGDYSGISGPASGKVLSQIFLESITDYYVPTKKEPTQGT